MNPNTMVIDGAFVYWLNDFSGTVMRVPKCGGARGAPVEFARGQLRGESLAIDADNLYWIHGRDLMKMPKDGGTPVKIALGRRSIHPDGDALLWIDDRGLMTMPRAGGSEQVLAKLLVPDLLASDADAFYWGDHASGKVIKMPRAGGERIALASGQAGATVAIDGSHVYWVTDASGEVRKVAKGGGEITTFSEAERYPKSIALDAGNVYWTNWNYSNGEVRKVPKAGGAVVTLADHLPSRALAVDDAAVYWTVVYDEATLEGDRVMRLDL